MASGDTPNSVKEARDRFDLLSDANLATRLQNEEFGAHFNANRQERRLVGSDTKMSREEQIADMQRQQELRRAQLNRVASTDEEIARRLQEEFNREEEVKRFLARKQAEDDERIAREIQDQEQGRIVGYGPSSIPPPLPSTSSIPSGSSTRRQNDPHHIYAAQNNLNEHYADRVTPSLIDYNAEDALTTLPSPPVFSPSTNIDPFLSSSESRVAAYAPSTIVPLLPPPPEFVVRREQERVMDELNRLQPRLAMFGLSGGDHSSYTVPPTSSLSPPPAYAPPPGYTPLTPTTVSPPMVTVTTPTPTGVTLSESNPFLIDVMGGGEGDRRERSATNTGGGGGDYFSEFGLPPPSSLATNGSYSLL